MYIKFLEYDTVEYIKRNQNKVFNDLKKHSFIEVLDIQFGIDWYKPSKIINPEINFYIDYNINPKLTDYKNSVEIYECFKNLTESQASDERFWAGYAIESNVYEYLKYRWKDTVNILRYRVVYDVSGKRGVMYQGIARLWWFSHITYDSLRENPYELTEFAFKYPHVLEKMIYRNFSNSKSIRMGIIEGIKDFVEKGGKYRVLNIDKLYKYISTLGSVSLIDNITQTEIRKLTENNLNTY